jgi:hypothetical protein
VWPYGSSSTFWVELNLHSRIMMVGPVQCAGNLEAVWGDFLVLNGIRLHNLDEYRIR